MANSSSSSTSSTSYIENWSSTSSSYIENWSSSSHSSYSSHSTSSHSTSSASSSSHSSYSSPSTSSTSHSSSSSSSSSISSSSSSVDSNSSSSESEGDVSTTSSSSSSSIGGWNKSKPLLLATSAISSTGNKKLAQTVYIEEDTYDIGKVYCYFYGPYGYNKNYTIYLDIYTCNDNGSPLASIFSGSILGTSITGNDWYSFTVGISGVTPVNRYLSFVVSQVGGNEDDYIMWGYNSTTDTVRTSAWFSNNGVTWTKQDEVIRALKVMGSFNAYDLTNYKILTPPAEEAVFTQDFTGGTYDGTELDSGKVVISYANTVASFIIDSSGSMGWNDRTNTRSDMVTSIIERFKDHYPPNVATNTVSYTMFDIVKFGAQSVNASSVTSTMGFSQYINLDLNNSTRKSFIFSISDSIASQNAVYTGNTASSNCSFTVTEDLTITGTSLICMALGDVDPSPVGTLTKISGTGDTIIEYESFTIPSYTDGIVAFGFKNFTDDHPYNIGEINIGGTYTQEVTTSNWEALGPNSETEFSVGNNGPKNTTSLDLIGDTSIVLRRPATVVPLNTSKILADAPVGTTVLFIENVSLFSNGGNVDFVDVDSCSLGHTITNVNSITSTITVTPPTTAYVASWVNYGGIIQDSNFNTPASITGTTIQIPIRDILSIPSEIITFFIQTVNGTTIEWDLNPFDEWVIYNLYWLGDTAILPVNLYDTAGNPLPDGSEVQFSADNYPEDSALSNQIEAVFLSQNASIGATKIYVESTTGYTIGLDIDIVNDSNETQTVEITEVGTDVTGYYIKFTPALLYDFTTSGHSKIIKSITTQDQSNAASEISSANLLSASLGLVDVTPIVTGTSLNPALLKPYDVTPVLPSTTYPELNLDLSRIRTLTINVPTINGEADVRILPITEDNLKTITEKDEEASRLIFPERPPNYADQLEQNISDSTTTTSSTTSTTTLMPTVEKDYTLESPVYSQNGLAESAMYSYATTLTKKDFNISIPGINNSASTTTSLMVRSYDIYTALFTNDSLGNPVARLYFTPFAVDFTPPIFIDSDFSEGNIYYTAEYEPEGDGCYDPMKYYELKGIRGVYAGNECSIEYTITNKNILMDGDLNIRIYSNSILDIGNVLGTDIETTRQDLNAVYPTRDANVSGTTINVAPLSDIDTWRQFVENNPAGNIIESSTAADSDGGLASAVAQQYADIAGGILSTQTSDNQFTYYSNPEQWTWATQYPNVYNQVIPVVDGHATLTIPASDVSALLMVQASVYFGDNNQLEMIRSDLICNGNPIDIQNISPNLINATGGDATYEIGAKVTWQGVPIADNVVVSFSPASTSSLPSVSKTDDGWAGGVFIGPHAIVEMQHSSTSGCEDSWYGVVENVNITVSYLGYQRTVTRQIEWTGPTPEDTNDVFYFYVEDDGSSLWCDGDSGSFVQLSSDLDGVENITWIDSVYPFDGTTRILGSPLVVNVPSSLSTSYPQNWSQTVMSFKVYGNNKNVGTIASADAPEITIRTKYNYTNLDGKPDSRSGTGVTMLPYVGPSGLVIPKPTVLPREPLAISISMEESEFIRDGVHSPNIVADVTWKGSIITSKFTKNDDELNPTTYDYPFPRVTFEAGVCLEMNSTGTPPEAQDTRGAATDCFTIGDNPYVSLNTYAATVSLSRTSIVNIPFSSSHTHSCVIDSDGNGSTDNTIVISGSIADHTHTFTSYISSSALGHTHTLRSVAIVKINPMTNQLVDIFINGYAVYDPTGCLPYTPRSGVLSKPTTFPDGNRMVFTTLEIPPVDIRGKELVMDITVDPSVYTAEKVTDTIKGINIKAEAYFTEYTEQIAPGVWITVPSKVVDDGTRIVFEVNTFKPLLTQAEEEESLSGNVLVIRPDTVRKYMAIEIRATVTSEDLTTTSYNNILVLSNLTWIPSVQGLLSEPTNDSIYINSAISQIATIGASQIHDAVKMAAQRMIDYQLENPSWLTAKKVIFLLTDGDENTSEFSLAQAVDNVNIINGSCEVPVIPIRLGYSYSSDDVLLGRYAQDTCGSNYYFIDSSDATEEDIIDDIITGDVINVNDGIFSNTIDLARDNLFSSVNLGSLTIPTGAKVSFRYRLSSDAKTWSSWSEWYDSSVTKNFDLNLEFKARYFQYQIHLYGNENFETPELSAGITTHYYKVQTLTIFFQPIGLNINTDEYLASIHITHKGTIPSTSLINYGCAQFNTITPEDYSTTTRPLITPDRHTIMLTRYNELFLPYNLLSYTAINGGWPDQATFEVYRVNNSYPEGELVDISEYAANNKTGRITFYNAQRSEDKFVLCVNFDPEFRILCNTTNYGPTPISIDHIGLIYNTTKRILVNSLGNISHMPISLRLT